MSVCIRVNGKLFTTKRRTIKKANSKFINSCISTSHNIDRDDKSFEFILNYLRGYPIHFSDSEILIKVIADAVYYQIEPLMYDLVKYVNSKSVMYQLANEEIPELWGQLLEKANIPPEEIFPTFSNDMMKNLLIDDDDDEYSEEDDGSDGEENDDIIKNYLSKMNNVNEKLGEFNNFDLNEFVNSFQSSLQCLNTMFPQENNSPNINSSKEDEALEEILEETLEETLERNEEISERNKEISERNEEN